MRLSGSLSKSARRAVTERLTAPQAHDAESGGSPLERMHGQDCTVRAERACVEGVRQGAGLLGRHTAPGGTQAPGAAEAAGQLRVRAASCQLLRLPQILPPRSPAHWQPARAACLPRHRTGAAARRTWRGHAQSLRIKPAGLRRGQARADSTAGAAAHLPCHCPAQSRGCRPPPRQRSLRRTRLGCGQGMPGLWGCLATEREARQALVHRACTGMHALPNTPTP